MRQVGMVMGEEVDWTQRNSYALTTFACPPSVWFTFPLALDARLNQKERALRSDVLTDPDR